MKKLLVLSIILFLTACLPQTFEKISNNTEKIKNYTVTSKVTFYENGQEARTIEYTDQYDKEKGLYKIYYTIQELDFYYQETGNKIFVKDNADKSKWAVITDSTEFVNALMHDYKSAIYRFETVINSNHLFKKEKNLYTATLVKENYKDDLPVDFDIAEFSVSTKNNHLETITIILKQNGITVAKIVSTLSNIDKTNIVLPNAEKEEREDGLIQDTQKSTLDSSAYGILKRAENHWMRKSINGDGIVDVWYVFKNGVETTYIRNQNKYILVNNLEKIDVPTTTLSDGIIHVDQAGNIKLWIYKTPFCAIQDSKLSGETARASSASECEGLGRLQAKLKDFK